MGVGEGGQPQIGADTTANREADWRRCRIGLRVSSADADDSQRAHESQCCTAIGSRLRPSSGFASPSAGSRLTSAIKEAAMHWTSSSYSTSYAKKERAKTVQEALAELPEKIDHEQHAALLGKFGLDRQGSPRRC